MQINFLFIYTTVDLALWTRLKKYCWVKARIENSAACAGRNASALQLLAVSKTRNSEEIKIAVSQGLKAFGENYVQEALDKINNLESLKLEWHFIGPYNQTKPNRWKILAGFTQ